MRESRGLIVVCPLGVVRVGIDGLVGSDVGVAEEVAKGDDDVTERGDVVNGSEAVLRPLGIVRRFGQVSDGEGWGGQKRLTQMPLSVSVLGIDPCGVGLLHERIPVLRRAAGKEGDEEMRRIG